MKLVRGRRISRGRRIVVSSIFVGDMKVFKGGVRGREG
jgi:hypothetical protein